MRIAAYGQRLDRCLVCKNSLAKIFCKHCNGVGQLQFNVWHIEDVEYGHGTDDDAPVSNSINGVIVDQSKN